MSEQQSPAFSVLVAVRNHAAYVAAALRSLMAQTLSDWEAIVVDDHSTDGSLAVMQRCAAEDPRIKCFTNDGRGVVPAFNKAFSLSRGTNVHLLGSDDILRPTCLAACLDVLLAHPGSNVYHNFEYLSADGLRTVAGDLGPALATMSLDELVLSRMGIPGGFFAAPRSNCLRIWPQPEELHVEDQGLSVALKFLGGLHYLEQPLYLYRQHAGQIRGNAANSSVEMYLRVIQDFALATSTYDERFGFSKALSPGALRSYRSRSLLASLAGGRPSVFLGELCSGRFVMRDAIIGLLLVCAPRLWPRLWAPLRRVRRSRLRMLVDPTRI